MSQPLVSIVLPTHNGERYLKEAIDSCLKQTYACLELIIVDDASTDGTPAIISSYTARDDRVRYVRHQTNRKLPAALNTGFAEAKGDYLTWTSDDNLYLPDALAEMVQELESKPDVDIIYSNYTEIDSAGLAIQAVKVSSPSNLAFLNCLGGGCFLYRRTVQESLRGYAEDLYLVEDYDFWLRASCAGFRFKTLPKDLYRYRRHETSLTSLHAAEIKLAFERALARSLPHMGQVSSFSRACAYVNLAQFAHARGAAARSRKYLANAVWASPRVVLSFKRFFAELFLGRMSATSFLWLRDALRRQ
jgi:glycosyltransferase involved in cell wall biosynthesis